MEFVEVAKTFELTVGKMKSAKLGQKEILVANVDGKYFAIGDKCAHKGGDLSKGFLSGNTVTCPRHGAKFDVRTGKVVSKPKILFFSSDIDYEPTFEVKVEGEKVLIAVDQLKKRV